MCGHHLLFWQTMSYCFGLISTSFWYISFFHTCTCVTLFHSLLNYVTTLLTLAVGENTLIFGILVTVLQENWVGVKVSVEENYIGVTFVEENYIGLMAVQVKMRRVNTEPKYVDLTSVPWKLYRIILVQGKLHKSNNCTCKIQCPMSY